jgi:hypothetical protein
MSSSDFFDFEEIIPEEHWHFYETIACCESVDEPEQVDGLTRFDIDSENN